MVAVTTIMNQSRFQTLKIKNSSPESAKTCSNPKRIEKGKTTTKDDEDDED